MPPPSVSCLSSPRPWRTPRCTSIERRLSVAPSSRRARRRPATASSTICPTIRPTRLQPTSNVCGGNTSCAPQASLDCITSPTSPGARSQSVGSSCATVGRQISATYSPAARFASERGPKRRRSYQERLDVSKPLLFFARPKAASLRSQLCGRAKNKSRAPSALSLRHWEAPSASLRHWFLAGEFKFDLV